jgi:hypothetical protein
MGRHRQAYEELSKRARFGLDCALAASLLRSVPAISPDGKTIATGYPHGQLRLWQNPLAADWPSAACAVAGRNMTPFEWKLYFGSAKYRRTCPNFPDGKEER